MFKIFTNKPFAIYNAHPASEKTVVVRRLCGDCSETECAGEGATHSLKIASDPNIHAQAHSAKTASDPRNPNFLPFQLKRAQTHYPKRLLTRF